MIKLFLAGGSKIGVGIIVMIVTFSFSLIALTDGSTVCGAARKVTTAGINETLRSGTYQHSTVYGAAREVATAGINETLRSGTYQQ
ncbi:unnamed protein product [Rotaria sp. Silwood2]|nr:unnamed protein product [Rotaria sp. Silwood2]